MPNDFKLALHKFQFKAKPKINLGFDGTVYCEVLEIIPFKKLVYSWKNYLPYLIMNKGWLKIGKRMIKQLY